MFLPGIGELNRPLEFSDASMPLAITNGNLQLQSPLKLTPEFLVELSRQMHESNAAQVQLQEHNLRLQLQRIADARNSLNRHINEGMTSLEKELQGIESQVAENERVQKEQFEIAAQKRESLKQQRDLFIQNVEAFGNKEI